MLRYFVDSFRKIVFLLLLGAPGLTFAQDDPPFGDGDSCEVYVPNSIGGCCGDGICYPFYPRSNCPMANFSMEIYNRWGQKIFETTDAEYGWDPYESNTTPRAPEGTYYYFMKYTDLSGREQTLTGYVVLVR
jgi:hypothetical protein